MRIKNFFCLFVFLLVSEINLHSQQTVIIPQNYEDALEEIKFHQVNFFVYPYMGSDIDVREMKKKYPKLNIEDFVTVLPPNISNHEEVSALMTVVQDTRSDSLALIIWLAGDYYKKDVTLYIDENSSRSFKTAKRVNLKAGGRAKKISVYPFGKTPVELSIKLPKTREEELEDLIRKKKSQNRITSGIGIGGSLGFGSGKMHHDYISSETNFPGWYDVVLSEKLVGLTASKYFRNFKIELKGTYQNIFQYTSYFKLRHGEPEVYFTDNGVRVVQENLRVDNNRDRHSRHRVKLAMLVAPRIGISRLLELQPFVGGGYIFFLNEPYLANKFDAYLESYEQGKTPFIDFGVNLETTVGYKKTLSIGFSYNIIDWKPIGYFESIQGVDLNRYYRGYNFSVGYAFVL